MALFGNKRKKSTQTSAPEDSAAGPSGESARTSEVTGIPARSSGTSARKGIHSTLDKLVTLHGSRARLPRLCAEALKLILEAFGLRRGALLLYDARAQCLHYAAGKGLGTEGRDRLRRVRYNDPLSWDMPLRGLLNESAYLIDEPGSNRYVPKLVESGNATLARVAAIPLYRQRSPVGAFVLLAEKGERLSETEIHLAHVSLRYIATIIDDAQQREGIGALTETLEEVPDDGEDSAPKQATKSSSAHHVPTDPEPVFLGEATRAIPLTARAEPDLPPVPDHLLSPEALAMYEAQAQEASAEVERLRTELTAALTDVEQRAEEAEEAHVRSIEKLRDELSEEHARTLASVESERDRLAERLAALTESADDQSGDLEALETLRAERDELTGHVAELTNSVRAQRDELQALEATRAERDRLTERLGELTESAASQQSALQVLDAVRAERDDVAAQLNEAIAALESRQGEIEALQSVYAERDQLADRVAELTTSIGARDAELQTLQTERGALSERVTSLAAAVEAEREPVTDDARVHNLEAELTAVRENAEATATQLQSVLGELEARDRRIGQLEAERGRLEAEAASVRESLERGGDRSDAAEALLETRTAEIETLSSQLAAAEAKVDARGRAIQELKAAGTRLKTDRAAARDELARVAGHAGRLEQQSRDLEAAVEQRASAQAELTQQLDEARAQNEASERVIGELRETGERLEQARTRLAEEQADTQRTVQTLQETVAAHEQTAGEMRAEIAATAAREQELHAAVERMQTAGQERETQLQDDMARVSQERDSIGARVAELEEAARGQAGRIQEIESAARASAEDSERTAAQLREQVATREHSVAGAEAAASAAAEREQAARLESEQRGAENEALTEQVCALEQAVEAARARATELETSTASVQSVNDALRAESGALTGQVAELQQSLEAATARARDLDAQGAAAADEIAQATELARAGEQELERAQAEGREARDQAKVLKAAADAAQATSARLREQLEELERRVAAEDRDDLEAKIARLEADYRAAFSDAARAREEAAESAGRLTEVEAERDRHAQAVSKLEAAVARLEAGRVMRSQRTADEPEDDASPSQQAERPARRTSAKGGADASAKPEAKSDAKTETKVTRGQAKRSASSVTGGASSERFVIVEPTAAIGTAMAGNLGPDAQVLAPSASLDSVVRKIEGLQPTVIAINLGARNAGGGFPLLQALAQSAISDDVKIWAYVAPPQATKAIALGFINWMAQPEDARSFVEPLARICGRSNRVLTVGLETDGLLGGRDLLKKHGLSISMAWDSKQGQELLEMVNPTTIVVNLDLPRGDGYRALGRLAGIELRHRWVLCGGEGPLAEAASLVVTGATQRSATEGFLKFADVATAMLADLDGPAEDAPGGAAEQARTRARSSGSATSVRTNASGPVRAVLSGGRRSRR
jgi:chromosome segregation ATPase